MALPPAPPQIPAFCTGFEQTTPAYFDGLVQLPLSFLAGQIVFRAHDTTSRSLSSSFSVIPFSTVDEDPYSGWNATSHQWLAPYTGWYSVTTTVSVATSAVQLRVGIGQSGTTLTEGSGALLSSATLGEGAAAAVLLLAGGIDFVNTQALTSSASSTDVSSAGRFPSLEITYYGQQ